MRDSTIPQMMRSRVDVKKLKFSTAELRALALQTHCETTHVGTNRKLLINIGCCLTHSSAANRHLKLLSVMR